LTQPIPGDDEERIVYAQAYTLQYAVTEPGHQAHFYAFIWPIKRLLNTLFYHFKKKTKSKNSQTATAFSEQIK